MNESTPSPDETEIASAEMSAQEAAPSEETATAETPEETLAKALEENQKLKDQLLRAMAETENTRRRMQKEIVDAQKFGITSFAKDMAEVADNFARAMESVPGEKTDAAALKNFTVGIEAIERQVMAVFERFGIKKINPLGQPFDPHVHRVMMEMEDLSKPAGTIVQVFQPGYTIQDRLLREAQVVVSKGGPAAHKLDTSA